MGGISGQADMNTVGKYGNEKVIQAYVENQGKKYRRIHRDQLTLFEGLYSSNQGKDTSGPAPGSFIFFRAFNPNPLASACHA